MNDHLEHMIDDHGLSAVLEAISEICGEKAEHLRANWQDKDQANQWEKAQEYVNTCSGYVFKRGL